MGCARVGPRTWRSRTGATRTEHLLPPQAEVSGYVELNRLTSVNYGDGETQGYGFDAMGNRLTKTDNITGNETSSFDTANRLVARGSNVYTNDANGNTLTGGGRTNTWDSQNRLTSCSFGGNSSSYIYGADGMPHRSVVNGTSTDFVLDGVNVVREIRAGVNQATYFGSLYRRDDTASTVRWYVMDGLGSVVAEVDPAGNVTGTRKLDVYGISRGTGGTLTSKHGFVGNLGHTSEPETGLVFMRARYMNPVVGRFVSEDQKKASADWLVYCDNSPVNVVDRSGAVGELIGNLLLLKALQDFDAACNLSSIWRNGPGQLWLDGLQASITSAGPESAMMRMAANSMRYSLFRSKANEGKADANTADQAVGMILGRAAQIEMVIALWLS